MRQIKFRAWDKLQQRMRVPFCIELDSNRVSFDGTEFHSLATDNNLGIILLQYTELKDKSGKEIYEGDVVKVGFADAGDDPVRLVEWNDSFGGFSLFKPSRSDRGDYEIIGNIYEDPHLLPAGDDNE